uniref:DUF5641 domain-containing protein n=1 Tax=Ascaris lumbricoides TaxID=6252 RepID=A0A0M3IIT0_ASCLU
MRHLFQSRKISDRRVNRQLMTAYAMDEHKKWSWRKLKVGQVVKVLRDEGIPADLLLLSSSEPAGMAYIETSNFDGESNLKIRQALPCSASAIKNQNIEDLIASESTVECDPPSGAIYEFKGVINIKKSFTMKAAGSDEFLTYPLGETPFFDAFS